MKALTKQLSLNILVKKINKNKIFFIENKINNDKDKGSFFFKRISSNMNITESFVFKNLKLPLEIFFLSNLQELKTSISFYQKKNNLSSVVFIRFKHLYVYNKKNLLNFFNFPYIFLILINQFKNSNFL